MHQIMLISDLLKLIRGLIGQCVGYTIPADWTIMVVTSTLHLDPVKYKDPLAFNPWRWKDLDSYTVAKNFTPFGGGSRQCAGAEYSKVVVLATFLHVLVSKYRWDKYVSDVITCNFRGVSKHRELKSSNLYCMCVWVYRWTKIKGGRIARRPLIGFGDGIHIRFSQKWYEEACGQASQSIQCVLEQYYILIFLQRIHPCWCK